MMSNSKKAVRSAGQPKKQNKKKHWNGRLEQYQLDWLQNQPESQSKIVRRLLDAEIDRLNDNLILT
jgi:hypothetical protein